MVYMVAQISSNIWYSCRSGNKASKYCRAHRRQERVEVNRYRLWLTLQFLGNLGLVDV